MNWRKCDEEEISEFRREYWKYASIEKDYVESAIAMGDIKEAEPILTELINLHYREGLSIEYCREKLLEIYRNSGEKEKYRSILYDIVAEKFKFGIERYFELKGMYEESEWAQIRDRLLEKIRKNNSECYPSIFLEEVLKERLLQYVLTESGLRLVQKYEKYLMEDYADQLFEQYKKELTSQMRFA